MSRLRSLLASVAEFIAAEDVLTFGGLGALAYGSGLWWEPALWIVLGGGMVYLGGFHPVVLHRLKRRTPKVEE